MNNRKKIIIVLLLFVCSAFYQYSGTNLKSFFLKNKNISTKVESNEKTVSLLFKKTIESLENVTFTNPNHTQTNYSIICVKKDSSFKEPLKYDKIQEIISKQYDKVEQINENNELYIQWECNKTCGGWGDRIKLITSSFMLALLMEYRFRINITSPCNFGELFNKNDIQFWTEPQFSFRKEIKILDLSSYKSLYVSLRY
jgi:hypothetical protein